MLHIGSLGLDLGGIEVQIRERTGGSDVLVPRLFLCSR